MLLFQSVILSWITAATDSQEKVKFFKQMGQLLTLPEMKQVNNALQQVKKKKVLEVVRSTNAANLQGSPPKATDGVTFAPGNNNKNGYAANIHFKSLQLVFS